MWVLLAICEQYRLNLVRASYMYPRTQRGTKLKAQAKINASSPNTVKSVLSGHPKIDKTKVLKTDYR